MELVSDNGLQGWGRKVTQQCAPGYHLAGKTERNTRTCEKNGTWSGATPVCLGELFLLSKMVTSSSSFTSSLSFPTEQCHAPPAVEYAHVAPSKGRHNQGSTVHYSCHAGYKINGSAQRTCGANGEWSGPEPTCVCQVTTATGTANSPRKSFSTLIPFFGVP